MPEPEWLALKGERFGEDLGNNFGKAVGVGKVLVVALVFASEQDMDGVVEVVTPDGIGGISSLLGGKDVAGKVFIGLDGDDDGATLGGSELVSTRGDLGNDVLGGVVLDSLDGVEAETVEVIFAQPVESVFDDEAADVKTAGVVVIDSVTPWCFVFAGEIRSELREVISFIAEVVVNDIENHGETAIVGRIDKTAKRGGTSVVGLHGVEADTVVSPISSAGGGIERHEFDSGDAQVAQVIKTHEGRVERAFGSEGSDMEFVEDVVLQSDPAPEIVRPWERGIYDFSRAMHAFGKESGDRIGESEIPGDVLVAVTGGGGKCKAPVAARREHGVVAGRSVMAEESEHDRGETRGPEIEIHEVAAHGGSQR